MEFSSGTPTLDLSRLGNECLYLTLVSNKSGARGCHSVDERPQVSLPVPQKQNNCYLRRRNKDLACYKTVVYRLGTKIKVRVLST
jgi:hypothetical protein